MSARFGNGCQISPDLCFFVSPCMGIGSNAKYGVVGSHTTQSSRSKA